MHFGKEVLKYLYQGSYKGTLLCLKSIESAIDKKLPLAFNWKNGCIDKTVITYINAWLLNAVEKNNRLLSINLDVSGDQPGNADKC